MNPRRVSLIIFLPQSLSVGTTGMHHLAFCGIISRATIYPTIMSEEEKKENRAKKILKVIMTKSCPKLKLDTYPHSQEVREHQAKQTLKEFCSEIQTTENKKQRQKFEGGKAVYSYRQTY